MCIGIACALLQSIMRNGMIARPSDHVWPREKVAMPLPTYTYPARALLT